MKKLLTPPINMVFTLISLLLLAFTIWQLVSLKFISQNHTSAAGTTEIIIPDAKVLAIPAVSDYRAMVNYPLFWEGRKSIVPPKVERKPVTSSKRMDTKIPEGRLIGIFSTEDGRMAVFRDTEQSYYLNEQDKWGSWTITEINQNDLVLSLGAQKQSIDLISDFTPPQGNASQLASARSTTRGNSRTTSPADSRRAKRKNTNSGGLPHAPVSTKRAPPAVLNSEASIKEALAARQRLMAKRWAKQAPE